MIPNEWNVCDEKFNHLSKNRTLNGKKIHNRLGTSSFFRSNSLHCKDTDSIMFNFVINIFLLHRQQKKWKKCVCSACTNIASKKLFHSYTLFFQWTWSLPWLEDLLTVLLARAFFSIIELKETQKDVLNSLYL